MHFDHLTIYEGLSHNTVHCLLQDHEGYIWIGTQNGLNKYDGYSFEVIKSNGLQGNREGFLGRRITALFEDSKDNLWVGTRKNGINYLDNSTDRFDNLCNDVAFEKIRDHEISSFFEDLEKNIWITTVGGGLLKFDPETRMSQHYTSEKSGLFNNLVFDIVEDKGGGIWVATSGPGINFMQKGSDQFELINVDLPGDPNIDGYRKSLFLDGDYLWIGTEGTGLYRMEIDSQTFFHFSIGPEKNELSFNVVRDITKASDGRLYIATDGGGLNVYNTTTQQFSKYTYQIGEATALNSNALFCFWEDLTGNIWIGTYNGGINIHKANKTWFDLFKPVSGLGNELEHRSILSVYQSRDQKIWVGTDGGGLSWLNQENNRLSFRSLKHDPQDYNSLAGNVVKTVFEDSGNNLWIGIYGTGLDRYNPETGIFSHFQVEYNNPNSLGGNNIWSIAEKKDGKLLIGTIGAGLNVYDPATGNFHGFMHNPEDSTSISDDNIMVVFIDREERIWIGTGDKGLDLWDESESQFIHHRHQASDPHSLCNDEVRAIFQDSRGIVWIGTEGGGLSGLVGTNEFEHIGLSHGLIDESVMGITEDQAGLLWISSFEGISRIDPVSMEIRNFHFHQNQNNNQFNQNSILTSADGRLFFGGINGLNAIRPEKVKDNASRPSIIFTDLKVFNSSISMGMLPNGRMILDRPIEDAEIVRLSYLDNSFSISFSAIDYTNSLENVFTYKMEGFDGDWQYTTGGQHSATYTNLDPGVFTFIVQHKEEEARITIAIKPAFWQTFWFRLLIVIVSAGLILLGVYIVLLRNEGMHKQQMLEVESEILQLRNEKLAAEVNTKNSKLMFTAVQMAHKNEIITSVKEEFRELHKEPTNKLRQLLRTLDRELMSEDYWKEFNLYLEQVDQHFVQAVIEKHPALTENDLRLCSLMRLHLSTKEIASLLNISVRGVEQSRYRLKKRLGLRSDEDLSKYIANIRGEIEL
jgi:ligand-binding sensor domain-containing protein/DNA-binding CsgD family transcriptional regulator